MTFSLNENMTLSGRKGEICLQNQGTKHFAGSEKDKVTWNYSWSRLYLKCQFSKELNLGQSNFFMYKVERENYTISSNDFKSLQNQNSPPPSPHSACPGDTLQRHCLSWHLGKLKAILRMISIWKNSKWDHNRPRRN